VYAKYLEAVTELDRTYEELDRGDLDDAYLERVDPQIKAAEKVYYAQVDQVFVYGSDEAWAAHLKLQSMLPLGSAIAFEGDWPAIKFVARPVKPGYDLAYLDFQRVFCTEAAAEPRPGCKPRRN
jgi:hypothetical protein